MNRPKLLLRRTGASTVEFAVTLPILLMLVFGGVELGRMSMLRHTADHAAYLAARAAIVPGADADEARQFAIDHLELHGISGYSIVLNPDPIEASTSIVDVEVTFPVASNSFVVPDYISGNINGKCMLVTERPPAEMAISIPAPPPPPPPAFSPTPSPMPTIPFVPTPTIDPPQFNPGGGSVPTPSPAPAPAPNPSPPPPTHDL